MAMTVAEWADRWLERFPRPTPATNEHNAQMVRPLVAQWGRVSLRLLSEEHARLFAEEHPSLVRYARTMLEDARRAKLVDRNPFEGVRVCRDTRRSDPMTVISEQDVWALAGAALEYPSPFGTSLRQAILLSAFSGIRLCELARLCPEHVVRRVAYDELLIVDGKGRRDRSVPIAHSPARDAIAWAIARRGMLDVPMFRSQKGHPWTRNSMGRTFKAVAETAEVDCSWKMLRRFCASWMIDRGLAPVDVAIALHGNTNPRTLARYYLVAERKASFERHAEVLG